jgi:hypothetical protein
MDYSEFCNLIMPAANQNLRDYCLYGRRPSGPPGMSQPASVCALAVRIFESETRLAAKKRDARAQLSQNPEFDLARVFRDVSRGRYDIQVYDLVDYLESNGFFPRTEDLEAILRRCDHDADRALSLEEFTEVCEGL